MDLYPRTCSNCAHLYKNRKSFSDHIARGTCKKRQPTETITTIQNWSQPELTAEIKEKLNHLYTATKIDIDNIEQYEAVYNKVKDLKYHIWLPKLFQWLYIDHPQNKVISLRHKDRPFGLIKVGLSYRTSTSFLIDLVAVLSLIWNQQLLTSPIDEKMRPFLFIKTDQIGKNHEKKLHTTLLQIILLEAHCEKIQITTKM